MVNIVCGAVLTISPFCFFVNGIHEGSNCGFQRTQAGSTGFGLTLPSGIELDAICRILRVRNIFIRGSMVGRIRGSIPTCTTRTIRRGIPSFMCTITKGYCGVRRSYFHIIGSFSIIRYICSFRVCILDMVIVIPIHFFATHNTVIHRTGLVQNQHNVRRNIFFLRRNHLGTGGVSFQGDGVIIGYCVIDSRFADFHAAAGGSPVRRPCFNGKGSRIRNTNQ